MYMKIPMFLILVIALACSASDFTFKTNSVTGEVVLKSYTPVTSNSVVVIPPFVDVIGRESFCNRTQVTAVYIPDSVQRIDTASFYGLYNLKHVRMGTSVELIEDVAFWFCSDLVCLKNKETIYTPGKNTFSYCLSLGEWSPWVQMEVVGTNVTILYEDVLEQSLDLKQWNTVGTNGLFNTNSTGTIYYRARNK